MKAMQVTTVIIIILAAKLLWRKLSYSQRIIINVGQLLVIVEYCPGGDLLHYLRKKKHDKTNPMTVSQQIDMGRQVACGMEYLSSKKV